MTVKSSGGGIGTALGYVGYQLKADQNRAALGYLQQSLGLANQAFQAGASYLNSLQDASAMRLAAQNNYFGQAQSAYGLRASEAQQSSAESRAATTSLQNLRNEARRIDVPAGRGRYAQASGAAAIRPVSSAVNTQVYNTTRTLGENRLQQQYANQLSGGLLTLADLNRLMGFSAADTNTKLAQLLLAQNVGAIQQQEAINQAALQAELEAANVSAQVAREREKTPSVKTVYERPPNPYAEQEARQRETDLQRSVEEERIRRTPQETPVTQQAPTSPTTPAASPPTTTTTPPKKEGPPPEPPNFGRIQESMMRGSSNMNISLAQKEKDRNMERLNRGQSLGPPRTGNYMTVQGAVKMMNEDVRIWLAATDEYNRQVREYNWKYGTNIPLRDYSRGRPTVTVKPMEFTDFGGQAKAANKAKETAAALQNELLTPNGVIIPRF